MAFRLRFPSFFSGLRDAAELARPHYWGLCPHCDTTTPWLVNSLRGIYRCGTCGQSPYRKEGAA